MKMLTLRPDWIREGRGEIKLSFYSPTRSRGDVNLTCAVHEGRVVGLDEGTVNLKTNGKTLFMEGASFDENW